LARRGAERGRRGGEEEEDGGRRVMRVMNSVVESRAAVFLDRIYRIAGLTGYFVRGGAEVEGRWEGEEEEGKGG
jgi:hypothetical protein